MPLVSDIPAAGKTSAELAKDIRGKLDPYLHDPVVSVIVNRFSEPLSQQVRVVGEVLRPVAVPWRPDMSVLDVVIQTGGLTQFAAGNRAVLVRKSETGQNSYKLRLDDLLRSGDVSANAPILPGDQIVVPRSWF
jgi:polysaccharide export outer membrane protein